MGKLALPHRGRAVVLPPAELLEPFIERTDNHHFWLGEFYDDGLDRSAVFRWAPLAETATSFMVPRLLWHRANPDAPTSRVLLENTCGLFTCINPAHWARRGAVPPARRIRLGDGAARPVIAATSALIVHAMWDDAAHALCGAGPRTRSFDKTVPVTCTRCITTWVAAGHAYEDVE